MTDSSTSNGSPIEEAASKIYEAWKENLTFPENVSSYKDLVESLENGDPTRKELEQALIHSEDWAYWSDSQRKTASMYVNGHREEFNEESPLFPNVPQPFMGDLYSPNVVVVTFNPGFHEFVDWVLGGPYENEKTMWSVVEEGSKFKLQTFFLRMGYVVDGEVDLDAINDQCERAKRSWITEQEKLLSAIRGGRHYPFVPWKKNAKKTDEITTCDFLLPSPLNLHGENALPWVGGNWHCDYFPKVKGNDNHVRNYVHPEPSSRSDGITQIELFAYQSPMGEDVEELAPDALKQYDHDPTPWEIPEDHLIPSQVPIFNYLAAVLSQVRSEFESSAINRTVVIARESAAKTAMFRQAVLKAGGSDSAALKDHVYQLIGESSHLTLNKLQTLNGKKLISVSEPTKAQFQDAAFRLLGSDAQRINH